MMEASGWYERFDRYVERLAGVIGHADRREPLRKYTMGLLLPGQRKSVEPMAARLSPSRVSAEHQSLLHLVGQSTWSDQAVLREVRRHALPAMQRHGPIASWIVDDCGQPKKGRCSVGVANQYCGVLGKNENCQVSVSLSLANEVTSLPVAHRLYLPEKWTNDPERRREVKVPAEIEFATKWQIALALIDEQLAEVEVPRAPVNADAGYGDVFEFREGLTARGLTYVVGVAKTTLVWAAGKQPQPPPSGSRRGRSSKRLRRTAEHHPVSVWDLAKGLPVEAWQEVTWREGTRGAMTSRFAATRVRPRRGDGGGEEVRPEECLLIEWPASEAEPTKYWLSTLPAETSLEALVVQAKLRWRIERDYEDLKQEVGLGHYEGRGWIGYHHHWTLCIAAYGFLLAERASFSPRGDRRAPAIEAPALPEGFRPRGAPVASGAPPADVSGHAAHPARR